MTRHRTVLMAGISAAALLSPLAAHAQAVATNPPAQTQTDSATALTGIVVTATRRAETLLDTPVSVVAFSQETLDTKEVRNIEDLSRVTPGLTVTQGLGGISNIAIRGITTANGAATTGVYIDDTPVQARLISLQTNFYPAIFDLDRVEVLRGPQGTLFGAGSEGGAVRFITAQPSLTHYSGSARADVAFTDGGDPSWELGAAVGGPIVSDKLGFRLSAYHREDGGYIDRVPYFATRGTPEKDSNSHDTTTISAALTFAAGPLRVTPTLFYQEKHQDDTDQYWTLTNNPNYPKFTQGEGTPTTVNDRVFLPSLKVEYDLGFATLISNTAYIDRHITNISDFSATNLDIFGAILGADLTNLNFGGLENATDDVYGFQKTFSQELRLQSNGDTRLKYTVGLFYQNAQQGSQEYGVEAGFNTFVTALLGVPPALLFGSNAGPDGVIARVRQTTRDTQLAGFAQLDYKLTDRLTLTGGLRVSHVEYAFGQVEGGPFYGPVDTTSGGKSSATPVTPKFGVEYQANPDWLLYASAAKGFRQGGANGAVNTTACAADLGALGRSQVPLSYVPDTDWSYEGGVKGRHGIFTVAADVFDTEWNDIQRPYALARCGSVFTTNLGSARSIGVEALLVAAPARGLTLSANLSYDDATFQSTINGSAGGTLVKSGDRFAPPWSVVLAVDYRRPLFDGVLSGYGHLEFDYKSDWQEDATNLSFNPNYADHDAQDYVMGRIGVRRGPLDVSLYVNNLLNSDPVIGKLQWSTFSSRLLEQTFRPRTIGVSASYRY